MEEHRVYGLDNKKNLINYLNLKKFDELDDKWK